MTLEEISKMEPLKNGTKVVATIPNLYTFKGTIVGISSNGILPIYIVECNDGFLPNETYAYSSCSMPVSYLKIDE